MADEPQRHRIDVTCPECGHTQNEPALVVSTQCRSCGTNYQVRDGKSLKRTRPVTRLAKPRAEADAEMPPASTTIKPPPRLVPSPPTRRPLLMRLLNPAKPPREVVCFTCGHPFKAIAEAQSSQCPKCGGYVSLIDYDITGHWNRRIQTGGNVVIRKTGVVEGSAIHCHHLTVHGELLGPVECSGDLTIRSNGKIVSSVKCRNLRVEKGARVEFLSPVHASSAIIDGDVRGQISCNGPVTLEKRAHLHGLIRTTSLVVKSGAKHTGTVELATSAPITE